MRTINRPLRIIVGFILLAVCSVEITNAAGVGTSVGLNLMNDPNARASTLAGALGADKDEVAAFAYNPASLSTLESGQVSVQYGKGLTDDNFSQASLGLPLKNGTLGTSINYYNGGNFELFDGTHRRDVKAQTDLIFSLGYSASAKDMDWGITSKYFRSELIESSNASAVAFDFGVGRDLLHNLRMGASLQNIGSSLTYDQAGESLPRMARLSAAYQFPKDNNSTLFLVDMPFLINEEKMELRLGAETNLGAMQARVGYKTGINQLGGLTVGLGLPLGDTMIDYNFSLIEQLGSAQKVSVTFHFGGVKTPPVERTVNLLDLRAMDRIDQMLSAKKLRDELKNKERSGR